MSPAQNADPSIVTAVGAPGIDAATAFTTVIVTGKLPVPAALVAVTVALNVPLTLGVPEINPLLVLTLNPAGNPLAS